MFLAVLNPSSLLRQTLERMSALDAGVFVLFTSFVGHCPLFLSSKDPDRDLGLLSMFPLLRASIQVASCFPPLRCPCAPFCPYFLPRSMALRCYPARVCSLWERCHVLHAHVPSVTLSPARKVPRTGICQNVEVMGGISQRHGQRA